MLLHQLPRPGAADRAGGLGGLVPHHGVLPLVPKPVGEGREGRAGASLAEAEGDVVAEEGGLGRGESCYDVFLFFLRGG